MTGARVAILALVFFFTSGVSVVTGSTSAITVPVMFQFGIDPRMAVATNMFALTFMSLGGTLPFLRDNVLNKQRLPILIVLTLLGSALGAMLLLVVPARIVPVFVSTAIIGLAIFSVVYRWTGVEPSPAVPSRNLAVAAFRMRFIEAIATTKLVNIFSSGVATAIFMWHGLVDYRLGAILGLTMFAGALLGARFARRLGNLWLRRIYLTAVWLLGFKTLFCDVLKDPAPESSH